MTVGIPENLIASLEDLKCAIPLCELIELSNLDDVEATEPDDLKLQFALDEALALVCSYDAMTCCPAGKVAIRRRAKRAMIVIARYELDVLHRRPDVEKEYERILEQLKMFTDRSLCDCDVSQEELDEVGLSNADSSPIVSCFDERRWEVPTNANKLNKEYFTTHRLTRERNERHYR